MASPVSPRLRGFGSRLWRFLLRCIRVDTRSLAVFRIAMGGLLIVDVILRSRNFTHFYTEEGVVPVAIAKAREPEYAVSVFNMTTDPQVTALLFVVSMLVGVLLMVGYKTRIVTILAFVFVVSLDFRNPFVLSYADTIMRMMLFWAIFLPLGERWSVDAVQSPRSPRPSVANLATAAALLQLLYMYGVNGYHKYTEALWRDGDAAVLVMGLDDMSFLLAPYLRDFPLFLEFGGLLWYYLLLFAWILLFLPGRLRMLYAGLIAGGHVSFAITVRIGAFPYVPLAGLMLFMQTRFWNDLAAVGRLVGVHASDFRPVREGLIDVAKLFPDVRFEHRHLETVKSSVYIVVLVWVVMGMVFLSTVPFAQDGGVIEDEPVGPQEELETLANAVNVNQPTWTVFAPTPRSTDRYYVFKAESIDGERYDVYNERPMTFDRPYEQDLHKQYGTYRERFYMNSIRRGGPPAAMVEQYVDHVCEKWEEEYGITLTTINMYSVHENVTRENTNDPVDRDRWTIRFDKHGCGDYHAEVLGPARKSLVEPHNAGPAYEEFDGYEAGAIEYELDDG